ncbi:hypothetical protein E4T48_05980 [Aureobasidium sp. EXF-10727]|nr:hypothetical protein E4T48_05980 [Aureobasidium sp. EXF-10727]
MFSQRLLFLVTFFTLALGVFSSPLLERATSKCTDRDIAIVRRTVSDEVYFCKWWLSDIRTRSPFLEITQSQVTDLCKCLTSSTTVSKPKREEGSVENVLEKRQSQASCSAEMSKQFTEPYHFCTFYNAYPRSTSPFALYSAKQLLTLCKCVVTKQATSVPFCSSQSTLLASKPTLLSQASQYCSSLLRPTVSAVKTITHTTTIAQTKTQGTSIVNSASTIQRTSTVNKVTTEQVIQSVTAKSTAIQNSVVIDYVDTTNIGTVSLAVDTETSVQTVTVALSSDEGAQSYTTIYVRRDASPSLAVPSVWKTLAPAQVTQACNCLGIKSGSSNPTTLYTSTKTVLSTATSFAIKQAQSTRIISVTRISTVNQISTIRSTLTSIVSTAVETQTLKSTSKATLTTSVDSVSTSISQIFSIATYTCPSVASVTPTSTYWTTLFSTATVTATTTLPTIVPARTTEYKTTITVTTLVTATTCTDPDPTILTLRKRTITIKPTIYSTVSECPPTSTLTLTTTCTASDVTTTTTTKTEHTGITLTALYDADYTTEFVTATVTPTCTTSTVNVQTTTVTPEPATTTSSSSAVASICPESDYEYDYTYDGTDYNVECGTVVENAGSPLAATSVTDIDQCYALCNANVNCNYVAWLYTSSNVNCMLYDHFGTVGVGSGVLASKQTVNVQTTTATPTQTTTATPEPATSTSSSSAVASICPSQDSEYDNDYEGMGYNVQCGLVIDTGSSTLVETSFTDISQCYALCNSYSTCNYFEWLYASSDVNCKLYNYFEIVNNGNGVVATKQGG